MASKGEDKQKVRFIDLFCGLGGTRLGLERACEELGIESECVLSSDKKKSSQIAYKHNFGEDIEGDVTKINAREIPDFDVLLGGFPCFAAGTKILTDKGYVPIEDIRPGDMALTHRSRYREVISVGKTEEAETVILEGRGALGAIECTPNHPFYARTVEEEHIEDPGEREVGGHIVHPTEEIRYTYGERKWVHAEDMMGLIWLIPWAPDGDSWHRALPAGGVWGYERNESEDVIGWWGRCESVRSSGRMTTVYNMEVAEDNSYTANGIAVHNCQAFSRAGMRRGFNDTRGTMFFEIERILREKMPRYVLLENVPELLTHDKGNTFRVIRENLESLGYKVSADVLDGTDFGLAQSRRRTFVTAVFADDAVNLDRMEKVEEQSVMGDVMEEGLPLLDDEYSRALLRGRRSEDLAGYMITDKRRGEKVLHSWDIAMHGEVNDIERHVMETILSEQRKRKWAEELGIRWRDGIPMNKDQISRATGMPEGELSPAIDSLVEKGYLIPRHPYCDDSLEERMDLPLGYKLITSRVSFPLHRILGPDDQCITLTATDATHIGVIDGDGVRKLSVRECLRLFGFPEGYDLSCVDEAKAYDLVGNSICIPVVAAVAREMFLQAPPK